MPYQVQVKLKGATAYLSVIDKDEKWIEEYLASPRRFGQQILFAGSVLDWIDIDEVHITDTGSLYLTDVYSFRKNRINIGLLHPFWRDSELAGHEASEVTNFFITGAPGQLSEEAYWRRPAAKNRKSVMVICRHDSKAKDALFGWLRSVGLQPQEWAQLTVMSGSASPFIGNILQRATQHSQAVVALFTPDEHVCGRSDLPAADTVWRLQARPNVVLETGMALITHPDQTLLVVLGRPELPSDLAGRHFIRINGSPEPLNDMANRLEAAGCEVDRTGTDWLDPSHFPDRSSVNPRQQTSSDA